MAAAYGLTFHCDPYAAVLDRPPQDLPLIRALLEAAQSLEGAPPTPSTSGGES